MYTASSVFSGRGKEVFFVLCLLVQWENRPLSLAMMNTYVDYKWRVPRAFISFMDSLKRSHYSGSRIQSSFSTAAHTSVCWTRGRSEVPESVQGQEEAVRKVQRNPRPCVRRISLQMCTFCKLVWVKFMSGTPVSTHNHCQRVQAFQPEDCADEVVFRLR